MSRARRCAKPSDCWSRAAASWRRGRIAAPSWLGAASRSSPIFEALRELEGLCAGFGAMRMTSDERVQLARINASLLAAERGGDPQRYHELNESFHAAIYSGSHNAYLARLAAETRARIAPFSRAQFRTGGRLARSQAEHESILDAIGSNEAQAASTAMRRHIENVYDAYGDYVIGI